MVQGIHRVSVVSIGFFICSNGKTMNNEEVRTWKEVAMASFKIRVLSRHLHGESENRH
jgi:hypothetical protein